MTRKEASPDFNSNKVTPKRVSKILVNSNENDKQGISETNLQPNFYNVSSSGTLIRNNSVINRNEFI